MKLKSLLSAAAVVAVSASAASAAVISAGGAGTIIPTPASVTNGNPGSNDQIKAFNEIQDLVLSADLVLDDVTIAAGTAISSHMVFLNRETGSQRVTLEANFSFDGAILGLITQTDALAATDMLLSAGTSYSTFGNRGFEGNVDDATFSGADLDVIMRVTQPGDWIRVITVSEVPLPAGAALLPVGLLTLGGLRRRKDAA